MKKRTPEKWFCCPLHIAGLMFAQAGYAQAVAGVVKKKEGTVEIVRAGATMPVEVGTQVRAGDLVKTQKDATVSVMLKDESRMALGPNTQLALEKFAFNADTYAGNVSISVVKGSLAMVSGLLVKNNPANATIKTPTSTAAIRDALFVVEVP